MVEINWNEPIGFTLSAKERRAQIVNIIEQYDKEVLVTQLSRYLSTSEVTIRKDLTVLHNRGLILRTRGGAVRRPVENTNEDTAISQKSMFNYQEKERIGEAAAKLIKEGDHIFLDSGTTTLAIARHLDKFQKLYIVTNSIAVAAELVKYQRFEIILLGGYLRTVSHSVVGPFASATLRNISNYKLFLGVDSFSFENGISTPNLEEALLNQQMIQSAAEVIAVFDASKFNKRSFTHVCMPDQVDCIITDRGVTDEVRAAIKAAGIRTIFV